MIKVGPYGDWTSGKRHVNTWDEKGKSALCGIYISHGSIINYIQTACVEGESIVLSEKYGGPHDNQPSNISFDSINLGDPSEFLTSISGFCSLEGICTISFGTNLRSYGPFGKLDTRFTRYKYSIKFEPGEFFGFHGHSDSYALRAIGVYIKPCVPPSTSAAAPIKSTCIKREL